VTASRTTRRPRWRGKVIGAAATVAVLAAAFAGTTFVGAGENATAADTAVDFAALNYEDVIVPTIVEDATPVAELATRALADPEATGEELGRREGEGKPFSYPVRAAGTVVEGEFGEVGLQVEGMPEGMTVGIAIPPLGSSTAIRDAGADVSFGDFANQTEYQNVAIELNKLAAESVYGDLDPATLVGSGVEVIGATTWSSKTGGDVTHLTIVPVRIEVAP
jgi:predicted lipoprotein